MVWDQFKTAFSRRGDSDIIVYREGSFEAIQNKSKPITYFECQDVIGATIDNTNLAHFHFAAVIFFLLVVNECFKVLEALSSDFFWKYITPVLAHGPLF